MTERSRYFITTAIDYPNSRPHIGTAFEKLGADVQARYRRMEGYDVYFLMGNDENTIKVAKKAEELRRDPKEYCDDMARQFQQVWSALDISFNDFIQTTESRHHDGCRKFIQKVYDAGHIYEGKYEGFYCDGCESFKTEKELEAGNCPIHKTPAIQRSEPCYFFALKKFQDRLLAFYEEYPDFIQPESRKNEILNLVQGGLEDVNITRSGQSWGIKVPWNENYRIYVWFDALLNYITAIGYGWDERLFEQWWPAQLHVIGKDITRFHCALWPAMLMAAELPIPERVFGHGFVYIRKPEEKQKETDKKGQDPKGQDDAENNEERVKSSKSGLFIDPMDIITKFNSEAFRYYFLRECPFPSDGEYSDERFTNLYNADLANNLGNLYSRVITLVTKNYEGHLQERGDVPPGVIYANVDLETVVGQIEDHIEACQYNQALQRIWQGVLDPSNRYADQKEPWKLVKTDKEAARHVLYDLVEQLRVVSILLKPFLPRTAATIYQSFNFPQDWDSVRHEDTWNHARQSRDLRVLAQLEAGKVKPLFPRIN